MTVSEFEDLVDGAAAEAAPRPTVALKPIATTRYSPTALYVVATGGGLCRAALAGEEVVLTRLIGGGQQRLSRADWAARVAAGQIREVA